MSEHCGTPPPMLVASSTSEGLKSESTDWKPGGHPPVPLLVQTWIDEPGTVTLMEKYCALPPGLMLPTTPGKPSMSSGIWRVLAVAFA